MNYYDILFPDNITIKVKTDLGLFDVNEVISRSSGVLSYEKTTIYNPKSRICVQERSKESGLYKARNLDEVVIK